MARPRPVTRSSMESRTPGVVGDVVFRMHIRAAGSVGAPADLVAAFPSVAELTTASVFLLRAS